MIWYFNRKKNDTLIIKNIVLKISPKEQNALKLINGVRPLITTLRIKRPNCRNSESSMAFKLKICYKYIENCMCWSCRCRARKHAKKIWKKSNCRKLFASASNSSNRNGTKLPPIVVCPIREKLQFIFIQGSAILTMKGFHYLIINFWNSLRSVMLSWRSCTFYSTTGMYFSPAWEVSPRCKTWLNISESRGIKSDRFQLKIWLLVGRILFLFSRLCVLMSYRHFKPRTQSFT